MSPLCSEMRLALGRLATRIYGISKSCLTSSIRSVASVDALVSMRELAHLSPTDSRQMGQRR